MAISKSTPYVRYKKDFTSSLHLGTIHIESEYLDRTQKTTIESIHGMTWHNKVVNENKELNLLSDTQLELTELEKQYWNTGEKRVSVDEIHTLEEVEPNEDGTYTYTVNSMEGEYIEIYDGINNITSTSDGLDGQFEIVYDTTEEDINGNIALDQVVSQYEITDSGVGTITGAKSTGLTLVNHITEPSKEEVVAIQEYEGQYFTIENTVQGNIKSATLKGQTLVNLLKVDNKYLIATIGTSDFDIQTNKSVKTTIKDATTANLYPLVYFKDYSMFKANTKYLVLFDDLGTNDYVSQISVKSFTGGGDIADKATSKKLARGKILFTTRENLSDVVNRQAIVLETGNRSYNSGDIIHIENVRVFEYQEGMENWDIPYFEGMQSVKMPVLTTTGKNLVKNIRQYYQDVAIFDTQPLKNGEDYIYSTINFSIASGYVSIFSSLTGESYRIQNWSENIKKFTVPNDGITYDRIRLWKTGFNYDENTMSLQIEEGLAATTYEPFKSNILTTSEEVELRGIGDVKDELNLLTGELTQRIGEVVLNGSENWVQRGDILTNTIPFAISFKEASSKSTIICDKFKNNGSWTLDEEHIWLDNTTLQLHISKTKATNVSEFKTWLANNNVRLNFKVSQESIKTVDLTVQNQDGNTIPHIQTQQGITHVSTSSDGLIPVVEMSCSYDTIIKPNTTYTIKLDRPIVSDTMYLQVDLGGTMMMLDADVNAFTIKTPSTLSHNQLRLSGTGNTIKEIIVLEGNRVNDKIEYFEGMKNVENPILIVSNCPYVFGKGGRI